MAWTRDQQRAILAAKDVLAKGGRIQVSSRSFWAQHGFPAVNTRRDIVQAARELLRVSNEIEAGTIQGTLAQALTDAGLPTTDISGGLTGATQGTIYFKVRYGNESQGYQFKSIKTTLPWYSSLSQLESLVGGMIEQFGQSYGLTEGVLETQSLSIY